MIVERFSVIRFGLVFVIGIFVVLIFTESGAQAAYFEVTKAIADLSEMADDFNGMKFEYLVLLPSGDAFKMEKYPVYAVDVKGLPREDRNLLKGVEAAYYTGDVPVKVLYLKEEADQLIYLYEADGTVLKTFANAAGYGSVVVGGREGGLV